jgi:hypothetical protein
LQTPGLASAAGTANRAMHGSESDHDVAATLDAIRMLVEAQV